MKEMSNLNLPVRRATRTRAQKEKDMPSNRALPSRSDVIYIQKYFGTIPFNIMAAHLNINPKKLMRFARLIFGPKQHELKWKRMIETLEFMEGQSEVEAEILNEKIMQTKRYHAPVRRKIVNLNRMYYLCTLNYSKRYIVKFDIPVDLHTIEFCSVAMGCDYEVAPLGPWEYMQLEKDLPIVSIEANEDYVGSFWLAMQSMLNE
jgi:hypothetical protein